MTVSYNGDGTYSSTGRYFFESIRGFGFVRPDGDSPLHEPVYFKLSQCAGLARGSRVHVTWREHSGGKRLAVTVRPA